MTAVRWTDRGVPVTPAQARALERLRAERVVPAYTLHAGTRRALRRMGFTRERFGLHPAFDVIDSPDLFPRRQLGLVVELHPIIRADMSERGLLP